MLYPDFNELLSFKDWGLKEKTKASALVSSLRSGSSLSSFRGRGLDFDSVREYVTGDDIRNIDWRVTARMGAPHLKLFQEEREKTALLVVDMHLSMSFGTRGTFKSVQAARAAAILGWQALKMQASVGAYLFGQLPQGSCYFQPKKMNQAFTRILHTLSFPPSQRGEIAHKMKWPALLSALIQVAPKGSSLYFISDFLDVEEEASFKSGLHQLGRRCDLTFISINDPADHTLAPIGLLTLTDRKGVSLTIDSCNKAGQNAFKEAWEKNRQTLYRMTKPHNIPLIELNTASDLPRELLFELKKKSVQKGG